MNKFAAKDNQECQDKGWIGLQLKIIKNVRIKVEFKYYQYGVLSVVFNIRWWEIQSCHKFKYCNSFMSAI